MGPNGGADLDLPQAAEVVLLVASAGEGVNASVQEGGASLALLLRPAEAETLGSFEQVAAGFIGNRSSFNSGHIRLAG